MAANFFPTNNSALVEQPISRSWQDITSEVYAGTPCLVVPFGSSKIKLKETFSGEHAVLHQYPRLLTLGTLLVDLGRQRPPNQPGWGDFEQRINNDFVIGNGVWEDSGGPYFYPQRMFEFRPKMARKIIKAAVRDSGARINITLALVRSLSGLTQRGCSLCPLRCSLQLRRPVIVASL